MARNFGKADDMATHLMLDADSAHGAGFEGQLPAGTSGGVQANYDGAAAGPAAKRCGTTRQRRLLAVAAALTIASLVVAIAVLATSTSSPPSSGSSAGRGAAGDGSGDHDSGSAGDGDGDGGSGGGGGGGTTPIPVFDQSCNCGSSSSCALLPGLDKMGYGFDVVRGQSVAQPVAAFTSCTNKRITNAGVNYLVPAEVTVQSNPATDSEVRTHTVRNASSLATHFRASVSGGISVGAFGLSVDVTTVRDKFHSSDQFYAYASASRHRTTFRAAMSSKFNVNDDFSRDAARLPTTYDDDAYAAFVGQYGTHVLAGGSFGGRGEMRSWLRRASNVYKDDSSISVAASAHFLWATASVGVDNSRNWMMKTGVSDTDTSVRLLGGAATTVASPEEWEAWISSVDSNPVLLVGTEEEAMVLRPLHEFVPDVVRNHVKRHVADYLAQHSVINPARCDTADRPVVCGSNACCRAGIEVCHSNVCKPAPFDAKLIGEYTISGKVGGDNEKDLTADKVVHIGGRRSPGTEAFCFLTHVQQVYHWERCHLEHDTSGAWTLRGWSGESNFKCVARCVEWPYRAGRVSTATGTAYPVKNICQRAERGRPPCVRSLPWTNRGHGGVGFLTGLGAQAGGNRCKVEDANQMNASYKGFAAMFCAAAAVAVAPGWVAEDKYQQELFPRRDNIEQQELGLAAKDGFCFLTQAADVTYKNTSCSVSLTAGDQWVLTAQRDGVDLQFCAASCVRRAY